MNFSKQVEKAKGQSFATRKSKEFGSNLLSSNFEKFDPADVKKIIETPDFEHYMNEAYAQHGEHDNYGLGYSIRWNPHTGQKEMFVAGSQGWKDWLMNVTDSVAYGGEKVFGKVLDKSFEEETGLPAVIRPHLTQYNRYRAERSKKLSAIARDEHIDVIYGHSRGGAVVADLDTESRKVGVDAAMLIAHNTDMENYRRPGAFDKFLGITGQENLTVESGHGIHWAYGDGYS